VVHNMGYQVCVVLQSACNTLRHTASGCVHSTRIHVVGCDTAAYCRALQWGVRSSYRYTLQGVTLQHTATNRNTLQHTATHCNTLQHTATHCNAPQRTATHYNTNTLSHTSSGCVHMTHIQAAGWESNFKYAKLFTCMFNTHDSVICVHTRNTLQYTATHRNALQRTVTHCNTLQHSATHCNTLQHAATHHHTLYYSATGNPSD